ncbi:MarR family transcriptional regulator [Maritalea porphyrae]|uniref:MarR family winged helix-turn-helix transcriptional regulator n=1 Tax=Maritalea porphyrae TaxID=880732 RepID=UPI0022AF9B40|nr:MarR family transcriptional regulator [Maritalea porphyrae]MCZ4272348.1 MarR family transcriptional regulator [Maritalea porphyrae]
MTKKPELIDHIGLDLWSAAHSWRQRLIREMVIKGYDWFDGAPGMLTMHIGPNGISQTALQTKTSLSKQAVQQLLDKLERDGIIVRTQNPKDKRAKLVRFTDIGLQAFTLANEVKLNIESEYENHLGQEQFKLFKKFLAQVKKINDQ